MVSSGAHLIMHLLPATTPNAQLLVVKLPFVTVAVPIDCRCKVETMRSDYLSQHFYPSGDLVVTVGDPKRVDRCLMPKNIFLGMQVEGFLVVPVMSMSCA